MDYKSFLAFAADTAVNAGKLTLGYFQTGIQPDFKADDSPVTVADKKAEEYIRNCIEKQYPDHAILGEEFGESEHQNAAFKWYVDPIDGTKSFISGVPMYAVLIGLEIEGVSRVGAVYYPGTDELLCAADGEGCWWNGRRAWVSQKKDLSKAIIAHADTTTFARQKKGEAWQRLQDAVYYRAGWCDAYGYLLTATGRIDLMLDPAMNPWDCAPFPPIFREAGGFFGDWQGNETILQDEALGTSKILLPQVLKILNQ